MQNIRPEDETALDYEQAAFPKRENEKGNQKYPRAQTGQKKHQPVRPAKTVRPSTAFNLREDPGSKQSGNCRNYLIDKSKRQRDVGSGRRRRTYQMRLLNRKSSNRDDKGRDHDKNQYAPARA